MNYDIIVIGGGPAGLSAAVQARVRNKSVLVVRAPAGDLPLARARRVDNYLGLPGLDGREMLERYVSDNQKNFINFNSEEYDQVMEKALTTLDQGEQTQLYKQAQTILNEEAASLWIQDLCDLVVMNPALDGVTFYATYVLDMSTIHYK